MAAIWERFFLDLEVFSWQASEEGFGLAYLFGYGEIGRGRERVCGGAWGPSRGASLFLFFVHLSCVSHVVVVEWKGGGGET